MNLNHTDIIFTPPASPKSSLKSPRSPRSPRSPGSPLRVLNKFENEINKTKLEKRNKFR